MDHREDKSMRLKPAFSPLEIWAFSIGASIGWGSFIVTCNTYLLKSGVLGTVFGQLLGMAVIFVITHNLQYMIRRVPGAGGAYAFVGKVGGKDLGFLTYWFILLTYLAVLWANITSVPLFSRFFLGDTFKFGFHYEIFGYEVWFGEALLSICTIIVIGLLCFTGARTVGRIMGVAALVFVVGFTVCAVVALIRHNDSFSFSPMYTEGASAFSQIVRIAAISPWAFIGFENVSHFSEEYSFHVKKVRRILISSVILTTALYIFVSLLSVSAYPPEYASWIDYISDMGNIQGIKAVPAFYATQHYFGQAGVTVLLVALFCVILTSLIGNLLALSRILFAAGRDGTAPASFAILNKEGIPVHAILAVVIASVFIPFLGRTAIGWIVDVTTLGATILYGLISYAAFRDAGKMKHRLERGTGLTGMILMIIFIMLLLVPDLLPFDAMETISYALFIVWAILGLIYFRVLVMRDKQREHGQRVIVWLILLLLVLFASMMWVARATKRAAYDAAERILEYHETHEADDSVEHTREERIAFLEEQAKGIGDTNTLFTLVSLGLFILSSSVILNNYGHTRKLGEKLNEAEEAAKAARKIAELKQSISSLLDNMPGINFAKDASTGVYLACNQAFAEYAQKNTPEEVIGLTDADMFDPTTAQHFVEEDSMALSLDEPYVFYEDTFDASGHRRQLQTTKLKYTDDAGRACILGMCQDVTDLVRIERENATTKEAYEKAKKIGIIFTHIAQSLAHGYAELYYVNLKTEEFTEYSPGTSGGTLTEERHGTGFFERTREDVDVFVHPEDREKVRNALDKETLMNALRRNGTFFMTYRVLAAGGRISNIVVENGVADTGHETYVSMKVYRMEDDEDSIILAITDVNEEMKNHRAIERMKEERTVFGRINALSGDFLCIYVVDPKSGRYREYSVGGGFELFAVPKEGNDFFNTSREQIVKAIYKEDLPRFLKLFTEENVFSELENSPFFAFSYRLMLNGQPNFVRLKAVMVDEPAGRRMIVGVSDIESLVRQEEEYSKRLAKAQNEADIDALTGVKNRHAWLNAEEKLDEKIAAQEQSEFAIAIFDVNDLKKVNDTMGHQAGDQYIRDACGIICGIFQHSPVFRVGGDEFAVIAEGEDYLHLDERVEAIYEHDRQAQETGGIVIACGMSRFDNDTSVSPVYERADHNMYKNKTSLKTEKKNG